jgi:hypothetical protein
VSAISRPTRSGCEDILDWRGLHPSWLATKSVERGEDPRKPTRHSFISHVAKDLQEFRKTWGIDPTNAIGYDHKSICPADHGGIVSLRESVKNDDGAVKREQA